MTQNECGLLVVWLFSALIIAFTATCVTIIGPCVEWFFDDTLEMRDLELPSLKEMVFYPVMIFCWPVLLVAAPFIYVAKENRWAKRHRKNRRVSP